MLDVPPHLLQPLCVDTNISYDLDMSKFPGLDDPQQMYQPALLVATDWSDYVYDDTHHVSDEEHDVIDVDLFNLIESCNDLLPDMDSFTATDPVSLENLIDDVITEITMTTNEDFGVVDMSDILETQMTADDDIKEDRQELSPLPTSVKGQKRRRSPDSEIHHSKKSKMANYTSLRLPPLLSVCPTSNIYARHRDS